MSDKTLTFTQRSLAEALNRISCLSDFGPELIAEQLFAAANTQQPAQAVPVAQEPVASSTGWVARMEQAEREIRELRAEVEILRRDRDACIEVANRNAEDAMSLRAEVEALRPIHAMVLNALDRDAEEGKAARGEMAAELRAAMAAKEGV